MKRIKFFTGRMMAVMLAWSLTMGSLSVPAFGAEVFEDMETAVETADEETAGDSSEAELQDKEEEKDPEKDTAVTEPDSNDDTGRKSDPCPDCYDQFTHIEKRYGLYGLL